MAKSNKISEKKSIRKTTSSKQVAKVEDSYVNKARNFLVRNKIFFETIAATFLTLMAIVLAWGQLKVTNDQTAYLKQQTIIEHAQALPQFVVISKNIHDPGTNNVTDQAIYIYNQGNIARRVEAESAVFFDVTFRKDIDVHTVTFPVHGYFWITTHSGDATGLVTAISGTRNFSKWININDDLTSLAEENEASADIDVRQYVKLSYKDIFDVEHIDYFDVPNNGIADTLDDETGAALFTAYQIDGSGKTVLDLDEMTAQDLYNLLQQ